MKIFLYILLIFCFAPFSFGESAELQFTPEQKKELAKDMGLILIGFTKQEVLDTFSFTEPDIWFTDFGQEVWYYPTPEAQNIYFKNDKVEEVEYTSKERRKNQPASKMKIDL